MGKIQQLKGVAHNLADSFLSPTNSHFLYEVSYIQKKNPIELEVDLISGNVKPEFKSENLGETLKHYKKWFYNQSNKIGITAKVSQVVIFFSYKPGKNFGFYLNAKVKITVEGKEYSAISKSGYS